MIESPSKNIKSEHVKVRFPKLLVNGVEVPNPDMTPGQMFDCVRAGEIAVPPANMVVTVANAKAMLQYETESEYKKRIALLMPDVDPNAFRFKRTHYPEDAAGPEPALWDDGEPIVCWRLADSQQPVDTLVASKMRTQMLLGRWVQDTPVVINDLGFVTGGAEQLVALIFAEHAIRGWAAPPRDSVGSLVKVNMVVVLGYVPSHYSI